MANTYEVTLPPSDISTGDAATSDAPTPEFDVEAFRWGYNPNVLRVKLGTNVVLHLMSRDVPHGFSLPEFNVSETIIPGTMTMTSLLADIKGTFSFGCDVACGSGHPGMAAIGGTLIVE